MKKHFNSRRWGWRLAAVLLFELALASCASSEVTDAPVEPRPAEIFIPNPAKTGGLPPSKTTFDTLIPKPTEAAATGSIFNLTPETQVYVSPGDAEVRAVAQYLVDRLNRGSGYSLAVAFPPDRLPENSIALTLNADPALGPEGYTLEVTEQGVRLSAVEPAGLFYAVQTLRQLFPAAMEASEPQPGPWTLPTGTVRDTPRFEWRGAMLDVARHFFSVEDVKRYIDRMAAYKFNRLHLHLSDDQGWRLEIQSWPKLTEIGGGSEVGGGEGGFYTQAEYAEIVAYAQSRFIMVLPEIDMPGHTNAALASYPELNCDGSATRLYSGTRVGFSSLCLDKDVTYRFIDQVIGEVAALTPGPYIHIGGDEAKATPAADYRKFMAIVQEIVAAHGKQMVGWEEIGQIDLRPDSVAQVWNHGGGRKAAAQGVKLVLSPAEKTYLDMQYDPSSKLGLHWAGYVEVQDAYEWDPLAQPGATPDNVLGVEAPLWSETTETIDEVEWLAFPRLPGHAEIGWSQAECRGWEEYRLRLAAHGPRLTAMGVDFYRSPQVPWE